MQTAFFSQPASAYCARCGKNLPNHVSVQAGKGPVCRGKQKSAPEAEKVESILLAIGHAGERVSVWRGECFDLSFKLHQAFKFQFIATADRQGAVIPWALVSEWVKERMSE